MSEWVGGVSELRGKNKILCSNKTGQHFVHAKITKVNAEIAS